MYFTYIHILHETCTYTCIERKLRFNGVTDFELSNIFRQKLLQNIVPFRLNHSLSLVNYVMAIDSRSLCAKKKKTTPSHSSQKQTSWLARRTHQYKNRIHLHRNTHKHKHTVNSNLMINHAPNQTGFILNSALMRFTFAVSPKKNSVADNFFSLFSVRTLLAVVYDFGNIHIWW